MLYIDIVFLTAVCYNGFVARSCMGEGRALQVSEGLKGASGMIQVVKRDGENAEFSLNKITEAIKKAFKATKKDYNNEILELLSLRVTADFQDKMKEGMISVEEYRTVWSTSWSRPDIRMWPRPTFYIENKGKRYGT